MGINTHRGVIKAGRRADLIVLDGEGQVLQTYHKGILKYDNSNTQANEANPATRT